MAARSDAGSWKSRFVSCRRRLSGTEEKTKELSDLQVNFISASGRDKTVAGAREAGAVDYIVTPSSPTGLVARVRAALRRHAELEPSIPGEFAIDCHRRRVTMDGETAPLRIACAAPPGSRWPHAKLRRRSTSHCPASGQP